MATIASRSELKGNSRRVMSARIRRLSAAECFQPFYTRLRVPYSIPPHKASTRALRVFTGDLGEEGIAFLGDTSLCLPLQANTIALYSTLSLPLG